MATAAENPKLKRVPKYGAENPNWKGGRCVTPDGYVIVRVGVGHHLADVRGYAYEHRVVAEKKIGRRLLPGEEVHHEDENRENNDPKNLEVKASKAEHRLEHRNAGSKLRMPDAPNPKIKCACGCGCKFDQFDKQGRPRMFISGHNGRRCQKTGQMLGKETCNG